MILKKNLQNAFLLLREVDQFRGLLRLVRHRFFHQDMPALFDQLFGQFEMRDRGRDDAQRIGGRGGGGHGGKSRDMIFLRDSRGVDGGRIVNAGKLNLSGSGHLGVNAGMFFLQRGRG